MSPIPPTLDTATFEQLVLEAFSELNGIDYSKPILDTADYRHRVLYALQYMVLNPNNGGGAFGAVYYFNRSIPSSISGYYEMSKNLVIGAGTTLTATGAGTQLVGSFATVLNNPNVTTIPSGNWNFENYVSMNSNGGTPKIYGEIYVRNLAGTETLIGTNISNPHAITGGTINELYLWSIPIPATNILATDRIVVKFYALDLGGRTMTMHFENSNVAQTTTSLPSVDISAYVLKAGDTMTGKLVAAASDAEAKLNIGGAIGSASPTTTVNGDLWITNQNRLTYKANNSTGTSVAVGVAGLSQPNTFNQPQTIGATSNAGTVLSVSNTGTREVATFANTNSATSDAVVITNLGTGNSLVINDEPATDLTRFVVNATGRVGIGTDPDATVALKVDSTGIKFGDGTTQTTAAVAGVTSISAGTTGLTPATATTGTVTLAGTLAIANGGTGSTTAPNALTALGAVAKAGGTMTGKLNLPASTTTSAPLNLGSGTNPTLSDAGDIWIEANNLVYKGSTSGPFVATCSNRINQFVVPQSIFVGNPQSQTTPAFKITQMGDGEAFRVEDDAANPDTTPFVISNVGRVGIGVAPDATVALSVDSTGIKFSDNSIQTTAAVPYASGNKVVKRFVLAPSSATGTTTTTASTAGDRGYFYLDLGDITKWNPTNASTPVINFYIYGSISSAAGGAQATFSLHRKDTSATITGSTLSTTSSALTILSATLLQSDFPSAPTVIALQYFRDGGSGGTVNFSNAVIEAVWTVN